jgi:hypothetical protein
MLAACLDSEAKKPQLAVCTPWLHPPGKASTPSPEAELQPLKSPRRLHYTTMLCKSRQYAGSPDPNTEAANNHIMALSGHSKPGSPFTPYAPTTNCHVDRRQGCDNRAGSLSDAAQRPTEVPGTPSSLAGDRDVC